MKSFPALAAVLAAATLLVSCSSEAEQSPGELPEQQFTSIPSEEEEAPAAPDKPADPNALAFEKREITLGPVDPGKAASEPFDVCAELTDAEWDALGFRLGTSGQYVGVPYCALTPKKEEPGTLYAMTSVPGSMGDLVGKAQEVDARYVEPHPDIALPGVASFQIERDEGTGCVAAVETTTGTVMAGAANVGGEKNFDQLCREAEGILDGFRALGR